MGKQKHHTYIDLPTKDEYYRLVWLGKLRKGNQPDVLNTEIKFKSLGKSYSQSDFERAQSFTEKDTITLSINVRHSLDLTIGSIWKNGKIYRKANAVNRKVDFQFLNIEQARTGICKNLFEEDELKAYDYLNKNWAKFVRVDIDGFKTRTKERLKGPRGTVYEANLDFVLIPCFEIARFYYFTSGRMVENIITGNIGDGHVFVKDQSKNENGRVQIKLGPKLGGADALLSALLCYDSRFTFAAKRTSLSFFAGHVDQDSEKGRYIDAKMPFDTPFELKTAGKVIKTSSGKRGFLVYEIIAHSSSCPIYELEYWPFHDNSINPDSNPEIVSSRRTLSPEVDDELDELPIEGQKTSRSNMSQLTVSSNYVNKYSAAFPFPKRAVKLVQKTRSESHAVIAKEISEGSLREVSSVGAESAEIKLVKLSGKTYIESLSDKEKSANTYDRDLVLQNFKILCAEVKSLYGLEQRFFGNLRASDNIDFTHFVFEKENRPPVVSNWCSIERKSGKWIGNRHLAVSGFKNDRLQYFYLIEIQRRTDLQESYPIVFIRDNQFKPIDLNDLLKIRDKISYQMGKVKKNAFKLYQVELIKHQSEMKFMLRSLDSVLKKHRII